MADCRARNSRLGPAQSDLLGDFICALEPFEEKVEDRGDLYKKFISGHISSDDGNVFIAEEDGRFAGYLLAYIEENIPIFKEKEYGYISDLYVVPEFRGKKVSSALKDKAESWFVSKGMNHLVLKMRPQNKKAHDIYRSWGFKDYHLELRKELRKRIGIMLL